MAIVVPDPAADAPSFYTLRLKMKDTYGEPAVKVMLLAGDVTSTDVQTFLTAFDAITNAKIERATLTASFEITGMKASASVNSQNHIAEILALTFTGTNPLTGKTKELAAVIPAWIQALIDTDLKPVTGNSNLNAVISFLEDNLVFEDQAGDIQHPTLTYRRTSSGFGSVGDEINALPG